ncbi:hypothetical protein K8R43_02850 [archaeon]|nr:hypothetical protein [archaeon]
MPKRIKLAKKRKDFVKRLTLEGMDKKAAQYEALRLMKTPEHFEARINIALHQFHNPIEGVNEFPHTEGLQDSIKFVFNETKEELEKEGHHPHVGKIIVREVINDLIAKRKIHNREWDATRDQNQLRVKNIIPRAKNLLEKLEKQRKETFSD